VSIFFKYIRTYLSADFKWAPHILAAIFLTITIWLNYQYHLYDRMTAVYYKTPMSILVYWCFYSFAFISAIIFVSIFKEKDKPIFNKKFILFGLIGLAILSLDSSYYILEFTGPIMPDNAYVYKWVKSLMGNLSSFVTVIVPLYIMYFTVNYFKPEFYGLRLNGAKAKNYLWLILFMIPLIYIASFRPDFLETYPTYNDNFEYRFLGTDQWKTAGLYELCYGFDFVSVELFFRGFLVVALSRFVGKDAILPMVVVYAFLHFGKPAGETISSIFGGYILGILAFQSRNIFGGLIAHLGVAWGMEYFAYLQS
jgi:hypothetical protein